jgi:hypothetical protein
MIRYRYEPRGIEIAMFRIGIGRTARVDNAIANADVYFAWTHGIDDACGLTAQTGRQIGRIQTGPMVYVDEIQTDGRVP